MNSIRSLWIAGFVIAAMLTIGGTSHGATPFVVEAVDTVGNVAGNVGPTSLFLDARGDPHIGYHDYDNGYLKYAVSTGGSWTTEIVDAAGNVGSFTSLFLDAQGNPHIAYWDEGNWRLKYAVKMGGIWNIETVDATVVVIGETSLFLDSQGNPHISYFNGGDGELKYAVKSGGAWNTEIVADFPDPSWFTSLFLDSQGNPHISYWNAAPDEIRYAVKIGGTWNIEMVGPAGSGEGQHSLFLDSQGTPHIGYRDGTNEDLKYAVKIGGIWNTETVDTTGNVGIWPSLFLDAYGNPSISYLDGTNYDLKHAFKAAGEWYTETVHATGAVGWSSSLFLDAQGTPTISYYDVTNGELNYASAAVGLVSPTGGEVWAVGSVQTIEWSGIGRVDIFLSVDGGNHFDLIESGVSGGINNTGGMYDIRVPHRPSRFCMVKVHRDYYFSSAKSDSFFTIETSIALLAFTTSPPVQGTGLVVSWSTDPGPEDLESYRLEKRRDSDEWSEVLSGTKKTSYYDEDGVSGDHYRLFAVNGLGDEFYLGETSQGDVPSFGANLTIWPVPFTNGELNISFPTGGPGGASATAEVIVYDVSGRRVKTIVSASYPIGVRHVTWNGLDENGQLVPSGIYFVRASSGLAKQTQKLVIVR